jgi:hypothetical protein
MKTRFWNVGIELYANGAVNAAIVRSRAAAAIPRNEYVRNPGREVFSLWFGSEADAQGAVIEALAQYRRSPGVE